MNRLAVAIIMHGSNKHHTSKEAMSTNMHSSSKLSTGISKHAQWQTQKHQVYIQEAKAAAAANACGNIKSKHMQPQQ